MYVDDNYSNIHIPHFDNFATISLPGRKNYQLKNSGRIQANSAIDHFFCLSTISAGNLNLRDLMYPYPDTGMRTGNKNVNVARKNLHESELAIYCANMKMVV